MCLKDSFFSRYQIVSIIFHEGSSFCIFHTCCHDLHQTNHSCCFPVTFSTESVTFFHQSLNCKTRKLLQSSKITKMGNNCLIIFLFQETLKSKFDLCLNCYMFLKFFRISSFQKNIIFAVIFFYQSIGICFGYCLNCFCNFIYRICINFPSKLNLCFYLIPFCNRNIAHIICNSHDTDMAALHDTDCSTHPGSNSLLNLFIAPMTYDYFSFDSHTAYNMTVFSVSMSRLVFIHEIHIDSIVRNFLIKLCMQMQKRFSVFLQTKNP